MDASNRALRFVNLLPHPSLLKTESKPALTSRRVVADKEVATSNSEATLSVQEEQVLVRRRAEALRGFFPKLFTWFGNRWDLHGVNEVNQYLSQANDLGDLERRIRQLEQRRHFSG